MRSQDIGQKEVVLTLVITACFDYIIGAVFGLASNGMECRV